jgi:hypothetical protein
MYVYLLRKTYAQLTECGSARCVCLQRNTQMSVRHNAYLLFLINNFAWRVFIGIFVYKICTLVTFSSPK